MPLIPTPLLEKLHELYALPRGFERFKQYLATIIGDGDDIDLMPLVAANPMAREHVQALIEELLALDVEATLAATVAEASTRLPDFPAVWRIGLTVADDAKGGWTNRYFSDLGMRTQAEAALKRRWIAVVLWSNDPVSLVTVRQQTLMAIYRTLAMVRYGIPTTLDAILRQEGRAMRFAGVTEPQLEPTALAEARELVDLIRGADQYPELFPCLYGDAVAAELGYAGLGFAPNAGLAVALAEALAEPEEPEAWLLPVPSLAATREGGR